MFDKKSSLKKFCLTFLVAHVKVIMQILIAVLSLIIIFPLISAMWLQKEIYDYVI